MLCVHEHVRVGTHQFDVVLGPEECEHGLEVLLDVSWVHETRWSSQIKNYCQNKTKAEQRVFFSVTTPACLLRSCETRETAQAAVPFPRGKKRAAPLTVRKLSLMLHRWKDRRQNKNVALKKQFLQRIKY